MTSLSPTGRGTHYFDEQADGQSPKPENAASDSGLVFESMECPFPKCKESTVDDPKQEAPQDRNKKRARKPYTKPKVERVPLQPEDSVLRCAKNPSAGILRPCSGGPNRS